MGLRGLLNRHQVLHRNTQWHVVSTSRSRVGPMVATPQQRHRAVDAARTNGRTISSNRPMGARSDMLLSREPGWNVLTKMSIVK